MNLIFSSFRKVFFLFCFTICCTQVFAQAVGDYRTRQSGDWNDVNTWEVWNGTSWVIPNANAFPVVSATASSAQTATTTTHTISLPTGISSGDLLLIFWAGANVNTIPGTPAGWSVLYSGANGNYKGIGWYKVATGAEGTSVNVTTGTAVRSAHTSYRIATGTYQGLPTAGTFTNNASANPNPPNLTTGFSTLNTLWIAATHSNGDNNSPAPTAPANYSNLISGYTNNSGNNHSRMATATRELVAASENPIAFTLGSSVTGGTNTVGIQGLNFAGGPTYANGVITVRNGHMVTVTADVTVDQVTIDAGGQVTVNTGQTWTIANGTGTDLTVNGTVINSGTITTTGATVAFNANSLYEHAVDGGAIPTSTWNATSTCKVTGIISGALTVASISQAFGNLTWDCPGETTGFVFAGNLTTINGTFTLGNTGGYGLFLASTNNTPYTLTILGDLIINGNGWLSLIYGQNNNSFGDNIVGTINVGGNFTQSAGAFDFYPYIATGNTLSLNKDKLNITGNFSQSGGQFDFCAGTSNTANFSELNITGDFSQSGTGFIITSTGSTLVKDGTITFNKTGTQTVYAETPANLSYANFIVASTSTTQMLSDIMLYSNGTANFAGNFTVNGILDAGTNQLLSSTGTTTGSNNSFTLSSGAGLLTANVNGVQNANIGTVSTSLATRTFSSAANYTYNNSTTAQNSGTFTTTPTANQVNNLTINNTASNTTTGVTLEQPIAVASTLTLTSGHITTTSNLLTMNAGSNVAGSNYVARTSGGSDDSFVNGPMKKLGNTAFLFPVGKVNAGHHFCGLSASGAATDSYTAEYKRASATALGAIGIVGLDHVSNCEYWDISRLVGATNKDVVLSWNGNSNCNAAVYVNNLATLVAAHFSATWNTFGGTIDGGSLVNAGSLTWANQSSFSPYSLGSTDKTKNPLPVKLINVKAYRNGDKNKIEWTNVTESEVAAYEVQKSENGTNFDIITSLSARSNASDKQDYAAYDYQVDPVAYYRIKVLSADGSTTYSAIVKVAADVKVNTELVLYPNPVTGKQFTLQLNSAPTDYSLRVYAANGQLVTTENFKHPGGNFSKTVELPAQLPAGQYYLQLSGGEQVLSTKFVVQ